MTKPTIDELKKHIRHNACTFEDNALLRELGLPNMISTVCDCKWCRDFLQRVEEHSNREENGSD